MRRAAREQTLYRKEHPGLLCRTASHVLTLLRASHETR